VAELCLVWGEQRRRAVIRHNSGGLESLVVVIEGRPQISKQLLAIPHAPLKLVATPMGPCANSTCHSSADLGLELSDFPNVEAIATDTLLELENEGFRVVPTARAASPTGA
jgi:hypothetical protein